MKYIYKFRVLIHRQKTCSKVSATKYTFKQPWATLPKVLMQFVAVKTSLPTVSPTLVWGGVDDTRNRGCDNSETSGEYVDNSFADSVAASLGTHRDTSKSSGDAVGSAA